jgi:hypothetical protein
MLLHIWKGIHSISRHEIHISSIGKRKGGLTLKHQTFGKIHIFSLLKATMNALA